MDGFGTKNNGAYVKLQVPDCCTDLDFTSSPEVYITWSDVLNAKNTGVQVWKVMKTLRNHSQLFLRFRRNDKLMQKLLHYLSLEVFGDSMQTSMLISYYNSALVGKMRATVAKLDSSNNANSNANINASNNNLKALLKKEPVISDVKEYNNVLDEIDSTFEKAIAECYTSFCAFGEIVAFFSCIKCMLCSNTDHTF